MSVDANEFFEKRSQGLFNRHSGLYRAIVEETNDPIQMRRVRVRIAELHDLSVSTSSLPWALPCPTMGSKGSGQFTNPCIGDCVFIQFEKGYSSAPVWTGFATPTRKQLYPIESVCAPTLYPISDIGGAIGSVAITPGYVKDYNKAYLPLDGRPMSSGTTDRYGNLDMMSAVGFYPTEHAKSPAFSSADSLTSASLNAGIPPVANAPDVKMMVRGSKYGIFEVHSDVGYQWKNEFSGDINLDRVFETKRWLYYQRVLNEDMPAGDDQRKYMVLTRYGHKFEMRDVGWNISRANEIGPPVQVGTGGDERWIKLRSKGGHLIQMSDVGCNQVADNYVARNLIDEVGSIDDEDAFGTDARFIRFVTRSGIKLVLDDRGSAPIGAEAPGSIGKGFLVKGKLNLTGYQFEFDEKRNSSTWLSPTGRLIEIDDANKVTTICSSLPAITKPNQYLSANEFLTVSAQSLAPASNTYHLILDETKGAVRLKGKIGTLFKPGFEANDISKWVEVIDGDGRGLFVDGTGGTTMLNSKKAAPIHIWLDDSSNNLVLHNMGSGTTQIQANGPINIAGTVVTVVGTTSIGFAAPSITFAAGAMVMSLGGASPASAPGITPAVGATNDRLQINAQIVCKELDSNIINGGTISAATINSVNINGNIVGAGKLSTLVLSALTSSGGNDGGPAGAGMLIDPNAVATIVIPPIIPPIVNGSAGSVSPISVPTSTPSRLA